MDTFLGAVKSNKISNKSEVKKSVQIIIRELYKLENSKNFSNVYLDSRYFNNLQITMEQVLEDILRDK